jgi:hypothetical protein
MTDTYKATPEQWKADKYDWSKADTEAMDGDSAFRCILELRSRIELLEAQARNYPAILNSSTPPPVARVTRDRDETGNYVIVHDTATPPPPPTSPTSANCARSLAP